MLWGRMRRRFQRLEETHAEAGGDAVEPASLERPALLEGMAEDVEKAIAERRRRLNLRLSTSLRRFRQEVMDEVEMQAEASRERQEKLARRQRVILDSLAALREDILEDIELTSEGVQQGGQRVESGLSSVRDVWEKEVNLLIADAKADVDLAVTDMETVIKDQRDEWRASVDLFNQQWLLQGRNASGALSGAGSNASDGPPSLWRGNQDERLSNVQRRLVEITSSVTEIDEKIEADLLEFKDRWRATTARIEGLPQDVSKLRSLADVRMYVADTVFAGRVPALLEGTKRKKGPPPSDPLDLRVADEDSYSAVLRPTAASNLRAPGRKITIITTAALPWMTGTSVNPLLRAAHLSKKGYNVTLLLPWLTPDEQQALFPAGLVFNRSVTQEQYSRWWLQNRANLPAPDLRIRWYPAQYEPFLGSIIQKEVDLAKLIPAADRDVAILEEPEHVNWYHHGEQWTSAYKHVVGVAHTNYLQYARLNEEGLVPGVVKEKWMQIMNNAVCAAHTDVVVKLSATLQDVPGNNLICNVHGVRAEFLAIGAAAAQAEPEDAFDRGAYFLGKALWTKGYRELFEILSDSELAGELASLGHIHTYGSGPDGEAIRRTVREEQLPVLVHDGIDHAHPTLHGYKVFVNPSTSDVLCTATAEALAMGKKVLIPRHPSNTFFEQFSNCIAYERPEDLGPLLVEALATAPKPMSPMEQYALSWEAATERLIDACALPAGTERPSERPSHMLAYYAHYAMGVQPLFDAFRVVTGASPVVERTEAELMAGIRSPRPD